MADAQQWARTGRGRELQFFAIDGDVHTWLAEALPPTLAPWSLVGSDKVRHGRSATDRPFACAVAEFPHCLRGPDGPRHTLWLRSGVLTPDLRPEPGAMPGAVYGLSGLILLQHGLLVRDFREPQRGLCQAPSRIAQVGRVRHSATGAIRPESGYAAIYATLRERIRRDLRYASIHRDGRGREWEDTRGPLWTVAAVRAHQSGTHFQCTPGRLLSDI